MIVSQRLTLPLLIVFLAIACEEPIQFELQQAELLVVDATVSTLPGSSYVSIYRTITDANVRRQAESGYLIRFFDGDGGQVQLQESEEPGTYIPLDGDFAAQVGQSYSLYAVSPNDFVITSSSDIVPPVADFRLHMQDTAQLVLIESTNALVDQNAIAVYADLSPGFEQYRSKFNFQYEYDHYFNGERLSRSPIDEFKLFDCYDQGSCSTEVRELVYLQPDRSWSFWDTTDPRCDSLRQTVYVAEHPNGILANFISCAPLERMGEWLDPDGEYICCCCLETQEYPTDFVVTQQSLSEESYNFWKDVDRLLSNNGLVFDTFPFEIRGNVTCENCPFEVVGQLNAVGEVKRSQEIIF